LVKEEHWPCTKLEYGESSISIPIGPFAPLATLKGISEPLEQRLLSEFVYNIQQLAMLPEESHMVYQDLKQGESPVEDIDHLIAIARRVIFLVTGQSLAEPSSSPSPRTTEEAFSALEDREPVPELTTALQTLIVEPEALQAALQSSTPSKTTGDEEEGQEQSSNHWPAPVDSTAPPKVSTKIKAKKKTKRTIVF
jgi:hypothetical protein